MTTSIETQIVNIQKEIKELKVKLENQKFEDFIDNQIRPNIDYYRTKKVVYVKFNEDGTYETIKFDCRVFINEITTDDNRNLSNYDKVNRLCEEFAVFEIMVDTNTHLGDLKTVAGLIQNVYAVISVEPNCANCCQ